jgi:hypothetical protein
MKGVHMKNKKFFMAGVLVIVLVFGMTVVGCATSQYKVEISNVSTNNIKEIYIRNAGTTNWGANVIRSLVDIDKSRYSETVDIRVVDTNGIVYSKYNVPFGNAAFVETNKTSSMNPYVTILLAGGGALAILLLL